jgi:polyisoprenoid-binding protein YceI
MQVEGNKFMNQISMKLRDRLAVLAISVFTLTGCADPSKDVQDTTGQKVEQVIEVIEGTEYVIDIEASVLNFTGTKEPGVSHGGGWTDYSGTIIVPNGDFTKASIMIDINIPSMFTDADALTETLLSDKMFDAENFPKATFKSTKIEAKDDMYAVSGNLMIHGVEKNITFDADVSLSDTQITSESEFNLNRKDFELNYDGLAGALIREKVVMLFYIEANVKSE